jgi:acyl dehydratase
VTTQTGRYFEDFEIGETVRTQGRTITVVDVTLWAMFTGDMSPMHVDEEFARQHSAFGTRFPTGLMVVSIASGLHERLGIFTGTGLAMTEQSIRYRRPAMIGDTVHELLTVLDKSAGPGRQRGRVTFGYEIARQDGTTCVEGELGILLAARTTNEPEARS